MGSLFGSSASKSTSVSAAASSTDPASKRTTVKTTSKQQAAKSPITSPNKAVKRTRAAPVAPVSSKKVVAFNKIQVCVCTFFHIHWKSLEIVPISSSNSPRNITSCPHSLPCEHLFNIFLFIHQLILLYFHSMFILHLLHLVHLLQVPESVPPNKQVVVGQRITSYKASNYALKILVIYLHTIRRYDTCYDYSAYKIS